MLINPISTTGIEVNKKVSLCEQYKQLYNLAGFSCQINIDSIKCVLPTYGSNLNIYNQDSNYRIKFLSICWQQDIHKAIMWANKNIVIKLGVIEYRELDVLIRIFTGMLNKCKTNKEFLISIHDNFIKNIEEERKMIIFEKLPF